MKIRSLINHPHVIPNSEDLRSSFWPCIDSNATDTIKAQKDSNDIVKIVHVTSMLQT